MFVWLFIIEIGLFIGLMLLYSLIEVNVGYIISVLIDVYFIIYFYFDYILGFVMNMVGFLGMRLKKLVVLLNIIYVFKIYIFNEVIWLNLSDENGGVGFVIYLRLVEGGSLVMGDGEGKGYLEICDGLFVKGFSVSYGICVEKYGCRGFVLSMLIWFGSYDVLV